MKIIVIKNICYKLIYIIYTIVSIFTFLDIKH